MSKMSAFYYTVSLSFPTLGAFATLRESGFSSKTDSAGKFRDSRKRAKPLGTVKETRIARIKEGITFFILSILFRS